MGRGGSSSRSESTPGGPDLPPYPAYKDSGVEWLGKAPAHWEVLAFKWLGRFRSGAGFPIEEQGQQNLELPFFKVSDMNLPGNDRVMTTWNNSVSRSTAVRLRATVFPSETIVFPKVGGALLTNKRRVVQLPCCIDNNLMGCIVYQGNPRFVLLLLGQLDLGAIAKPGPVPAISEGEVREIRTVFPPLPEQAAIVRYLDYMDRRIRRYIRAKQKLVTLLEEQKQALVHQAVTGRIDVRTGQPYSAYKPSGVEWLGNVPAHWEVAALRHRYQQCLGKMLDTKRITGKHLVPYLRNVDVQWDRVNVSDLPVIDIRPLEVERYTVRPGDLLVCEGGEVGRCAIWKGEIELCGYQKALHRLRPHREGRDQPRFLFYALQLAVARDAFNDGHQSTIGHLTGDKLRAHRFAFPPGPEQRRIEKFLDNQTKKINAATATKRRMIELLSEYRTRLIADVVTGKLDVREAAAGLQDK